jgi:DNA polymerase (family 10)
LEQARLGTLPNIVSQDDIRGDLHVHTVACDGSDSIEEMADAAKELGYEYVGITDHSQILKIARALTAERLRDQIRAIDRLN